VAVTVEQEAVSAAHNNVSSGLRKLRPFGIWKRYGPGAPPAVTSLRFRATNEPERSSYPTFPGSDQEQEPDSFLDAVASIVEPGNLAVIHGAQLLEWTSRGEHWRPRGNFVCILRHTDSQWKIAVQMAAGVSSAE
jgi:hypothetical protein